jgi:hypothetical protein
MRTTCKRMNHREIGGGRGRHGNARDAFGRRERGEECEREIANGFAKFGPMETVPGIDGIETFETRGAGAFDHAHQIEAGIGDGAHAVGETDQRERGARRPNFGIFGTRGFESGERQNYVADGAGTNQESAHPS